MAAPGGREMPAWVTRPLSDMPLLGPAESLSGVERELQELLDRYAKGVEAAELSEVEACMRTDEAFLSVESSYPNYGWADYDKNHLSLELGMLKNMEYKAELVHAFGNGDLSYGVFVFTASAERDGQRRTKQGMGTLVAEKIDGDWRIRHWTTCARRPPTT
ncbi:MAG: nuclear transport factor 2 family protein [Gammaproteobacteria bacterium]|nr:nuclear transport factor 2 family protein [Gammaproteobacteria bacterium]